jgi:hypothetical protein
MKMTYRGSMPAPKYSHGDRITIGRTAAEVQGREWRAGYWHYTCIVLDGPQVLYTTE